jgi:hypothetical protein
MKTRAPGLLKSLLMFVFSASAVVALVAPAAEDEDSSDGSRTVPRAVCGPEDHPETGLQGQVPAALRAAGFQGFNCNLKLIGQSKNDGGNW